MSDSVTTLAEARDRAMDWMLRVSSAPHEKESETISRQILDALLAAHLQSLAGQQEAEVMERARGAVFVVLSEYKTPAPQPAHYPWIHLSDVERMVDSVLTAAAPILLVPAQARNELLRIALEAANDDQEALRQRVAEVEDRVIQLRAHIESACALWNGVNGNEVHDLLRGAP